MNREVTISLTEEQYQYFKTMGEGLPQEWATRVLLSAYKAHVKPGHRYIEDFLFDNFDFNRDKKVSANEVYNLYLEDCDRTRCEPISRNALYKELRNVYGLHLDHSSSNRLWVYGISL